MSLWKPIIEKKRFLRNFSRAIALSGDRSEATKIPVFPCDDQMNLDPYQIAPVSLENTLKKPPEKTLRAKVVIPVSDEIDCGRCHMQGMDGTVDLPEAG